MNYYYYFFLNHWQHNQQALSVFYTFLSCLVSSNFHILSWSPFKGNLFTVKLQITSCRRKKQQRFNMQKHEIQVIIHLLVTLPSNKYNNICDNLCGMSVGLSLYVMNKYFFSYQWYEYVSSKYTPTPESLALIWGTDISSCSPLWNPFTCISFNKKEWFRIYQLNQTIKLWKLLSLCDKQQLSFFLWIYIKISLCAEEQHAVLSELHFRQLRLFMYQ